MSMLDIQTYAPKTENTLEAVWKNVSHTVDRLIEELKATANRASKIASDAIHQLTLEEKEGFYKVKIFCLEFNFTWRNLFMIGGLTLSVFFATFSFFRGFPFTALSYLIEAGFILFGAYYLSEWSKLLDMQQLFVIARAGGEQAQQVLDSLVDKAIASFKSYHSLNQAFLEAWQKVETALGKTNQDLGKTNQDLNKSVLELSRILPQKINRMSQEVIKILSLGEKALTERTNHLQSLDVQIGNRSKELLEATQKLGELIGRLTELQQLMTEQKEVIASLKDTDGSLLKTKKGLEEILTRADTFITRLSSESNSPAACAASARIYTS